ncbi:MAG: tetratricopeptide repeat protein [Porphyromonas sp.]|nr:tetratricopeptide repeat protein [Porphyromonas sp.]
MKGALMTVLILMVSAVSLSAQEGRLTPSEATSNRLYNRSLKYQTMQEVSQRFNHLWMAYQIDPDQPAVLERLGLLLMPSDPKRGIEMVERSYELSGYDHQTGMTLLRLLANQGDWEGAERVSNRLLAERPGDKLLQRFLITVYEESGQKEKALSQLQRFDPDRSDPAVIFRQAQLMQDLGRKEEAESLLEQYLSENPKDPTAAAMLVTLYADGEESDKALTLLQKAQTDHPTNIHLSRLNISLNALLGRHDAIKEELLRVAQLEGSDPMQVQQLMNAGREMTEDLTKLLPTLIETELELERLYQGEERFALSAANDYMLLSDTINAEGIYQRLIDNATELPYPYVYFIQKYVQQEDGESIRQLTEKGLKVLPDNGFINIYSILAAINLEDTTAFVSRLQEALQAVPVEDEMYPNLAVMWADYLENETDAEWEEVKKYYEIGLRSGTPTAYNNYAYALSVRGEEEDLPRAEELSRKAVQADSGNASFLDTYAWILYLRKAYPLARIYMEQAIGKAEEADESDAVYYEHYADILFALKEYDQALDALRVALEYGGEVAKIEGKIEEIVEARDAE